MCRLVIRQRRLRDCEGSGVDVYRKISKWTECLGMVIIFTVILFCIFMPLFCYLIYVVVTAINYSTFFTAWWITNKSWLLIPPCRNTSVIPDTASTFLIHPLPMTVPVYINTTIPVTIWHAQYLQPLVPTHSSWQCQYILTQRYLLQYGMYSTFKHSLPPTPHDSASIY